MDKKEMVVIGRFTASYDDYYSIRSYEERKKNTLAVLDSNTNVGDEEYGDQMIWHTRCCIDEA